MFSKFSDNNLNQNETIDQDVYHYRLNHDHLNIKKVDYDKESIFLPPNHNNQNTYITEDPSYQMYNRQKNINYINNKKQNINKFLIQSYMDGNDD